MTDARQFETDLAPLPTHAFGHRSLTWWGIIAFFLIEGTAFALAIASYFYLMNQDQAWPPRPFPPPELLAGTLFTVLMLLSEIPNTLAKKAADIEDFALLRSHGMPTYHMASCADDVDLRISHIIRGQDHLSNAFKHVLIFEALGSNAPDFAHLPLLIAPATSGYYLPEHDLEELADPELPNGIPVRAGATLGHLFDTYGLELGPPLIAPEDGHLIALFRGGPYQVGGPALTLATGRVE
jgi:hypothetical protein